MEQLSHPRMPEPEDILSLIQNALDLIITVDLDGTISYVSPAIERLLGYTQEEYIGRNSRTVVHPDDVSKVMKVSKSTNPSTDIRVQHKNGSWIIFEGLVKKRINNSRIVGVVINARDITERKRVDEEIRDSRQQLRNLSAHLQAMREEERKQISIDLHDELGQSLTALKMELSWLEKKLSGDQLLLKERVISMIKLVDDTVRSIQRISTELRPGILDDLGLTEAIKWQASEFTNRTGIRCTVSLSKEEFPLDQDRATVVFRIFQETLTNVARHASATRVAVALNEKYGKLYMKIKDNGIGINQRQISGSKSLGLIGIRERAYSLGGSVKISGVSGKGTTVILTIPIDGNDKTRD